MSRLFAAALVAALAGPAIADTPTDLRVKFDAERAEAAKAFSAAELAAADDLAAQAADALKQANPTAAARLLRDARWLLPYRPADLPPHVRRVFGQARLRHADRVNALAYSPDGSLLASASRDGTVKLWDLGNGRERLTYRGHADTPAEVDGERTNVLRVAAVAFAPDGRAVASAGGPDVHLWEPTTGKRIKTLSGHAGPVKGLAFGSSPNTLVSVGDDRRVVVWDVDKGKPTHTFPDQPTRVEAVAVGAGGKLVATVNAGGELTVYPLTDPTKGPLTVVPTNDGRQAGFGVAFAADGGILAGGGDRLARLFAGPDLAGNSPGSGAVVRTFADHTDAVTGVAATADGKLFLTGGKDAAVRVWEVAGGKPGRVFQGHAGPVTAVAVRADGSQAASASEDGTIRVWPLAPTDDHRQFADAAGPVWAVAASPDGKQFAAAGADKLVRVYDAASGKLTATLTGHAAAVPAVAFLPGGRLASASGDKTVKVWAGGKATDLTGHTAAVLAVAADPAGKLLVSGSLDKTVRGWDPASGKELWKWAGRSAACAVAVRADGKRVAVGTADGFLTILSLDDGKPTPVGAVAAHAAGCAAAAYHPDGAKLATGGGDGAVRVWAVPDAGGPAPVARLDPPAPAKTSGPPAPPPAVSGVAYSPDGKRVAVVGADRLVRLWEPTGGEVRSLRGPTDWATAVAFAPDGRTVYAAGADTVVRAFGLGTASVGGPVGHGRPVRAVAVSRDGQLLATAADDRTVKVWELATGKERLTLPAGAAVAAVGFGADKVVGAGDDGKVHWWSLADGKEARSESAGGRPVTLAVAADGSAVVAWANRAEQTAGFRPLPASGPAGDPLTDPGRELTAAALSADGTVAVTGGPDGAVRVWDLVGRKRTGDDWKLFDGPVADLALSADGKLLVAVDGGGTIKVADPATRAVSATVKAGGGVAGLAADGGRFATLAADGEVTVWDRAGKELRAWKLPVAPAAAAFTPDGKHLAAGNKDGTAYLLELP
ncbi:MAG: WD40 repeat domain-containing protein [Gemmataceae bacterium]